MVKVNVSFWGYKAMSEDIVETLMLGVGLIGLLVLQITIAVWVKETRERISSIAEQLASPTPEYETTDEYAEAVAIVSKQ